MQCNRAYTDNNVGQKSCTTHCSGVSRKADGIMATSNGSGFKAQLLDGWPSACSLIATPALTKAAAASQRGYRVLEMWLV